MSTDQLMDSRAQKLNKLLDTVNHKHAQYIIHSY